MDAEERREAAKNIFYMYVRFVAEENHDGLEALRMVNTAPFAYELDMLFRTVGQGTTS